MKKLKFKFLFFIIIGGNYKAYKFAAWVLKAQIRFPKKSVPGLKKSTNKLKKLAKNKKFYN